jgi:hypothetical protein
MGKKIKAPKIKIDNKTFGNVLKNTGIAAVGNAIGSLFKGGGGGPKQGEDGLAELRQKSAEYEKQLAEGRIANLAANKELTEQLQQQARGVGPLAGAQLRAAQNRNLAQTLAAAQSGPQSALSARNLIQARGAASRDLAELGLQERLQSQQALGGQIANQANILRGDVAAGYDIGSDPAKERIGMQRDKFAADVQRNIANKQFQGQILGGLVSGGAAGLASSDEGVKMPPRKSSTRSLGFTPQQVEKSEVAESVSSLAKAIASPKKKEEGAPVIAEQKMSNSADDYGLSDETAKMSKEKSKLPSASKEVNSFLDQLSARKYEYKNPSAPGAAEGEKVGIIAQDLEKSTLGKTLVKDTPNGKMVDTVQGYGAILAAQAELNRRMKKLEKKKA